MWKQCTSGQKWRRIEHWVIMVTQSTANNRKPKMLMIRESFESRCNCHELLWFRPFLVHNKWMNNRTNPKISMMHTFFAPKTILPQFQTMPQESLAGPQETVTFAEQVMFWSDLSSSSSDEFETSDEDEGNLLVSHDDPDPVVEACWLPQVPPHKRQKLDVPYRIQRQQQCDQKIDDLKSLQRYWKVIGLSKNRICCKKGWSADTADLGNQMLSLAKR